MKTLFFALCLFTTSVVSYAQQYIPMPTDTAMWRIRFIIGASSDQYRAYDFALMMNGQDTLMYGHTYRKIMGRQHFSYGTWGSYNNYTPAPPVTVVADTVDQFWGGIREENKRVYALYMQPVGGPFFSAGGWANIDTVEQLVCDFNLNVGDSSTISYYNVKVSGIDSTLIQGVYHKQIHYYSTDGVSLDTIICTEGIGPNYGIFPLADAGDDYHTKLLCFAGDSIAYTLPDQVCADVLPYGSPLPQSVAEINTGNDIVVYPNPVYDEVTITNPDNQPLSVTIFDLSGKPVLKKNISGNIIMDMQNQATGIYFVIITNEQGMIVKKEKLLKL